MRSPHEAGTLVRDGAERLQRYFGETIWRPVPPGAGLRWRVALRLSRFLYLLVRGFQDDRVLVRAPALTLTTLLALVPLLALIFTVTRALGLQEAVLDPLRGVLTRFVAAGQRELVEMVVGYVEATNFGALGGIGLLFLAYTAVSMLGTIEASFNDIWGVAQGRPLHRKLTDYLSVLLIFPVLLLVSSGLTAGMHSALVERILQVGLLSGASQLALKLFPIVAVVAGFTFLYRYMPNTRVTLHAAVVAGLVAGVAWHAAQWAFITFQIGVTNSNVIYGTFAALPIFLIWLNVSWIIVLGGCEIAYAVQHAATYHPPVPHALVSIARRERAALQILATVWERFRGGAPPRVDGDLAVEVDLPRPITMEVVEALVGCGLLARASTEQGQALLPARDLSGLGVGELLVAYRHAGRAGHGEEVETAIDRQVRALHARLEQALREEGSQAIGAALRPAEG
jgi:membrane protein